MKLWIDDLRKPPVGWSWAKNSSDAIWVLNWLQIPGQLWIPREVISFDHDLGGDDTTRRVVIYMIENDILFDEYRIHTANPVGHEWLKGMIDRYLL